MNLRASDQIKGTIPSGTCLYSLLLLHLLLNAALRLNSQEEVAMAGPQVRRLWPSAKGTGTCENATKAKPLITAMDFQTSVT